MHQRYRPMRKIQETLNNSNIKPKIVIVPHGIVLYVFHGKLHISTNQFPLLKFRITNISKPKFYLLFAVVGPVPHSDSFFRTKMNL
jgi:hypothetical protein